MGAPKQVTNKTAKYAIVGVAWDTAIEKYSGSIPADGIHYFETFSDAKKALVLFYKNRVEDAQYYLKLAKNLKKDDT